MRIIDLSLGDISTVIPAEPLSRFTQSLSSIPLGYQPAAGMSQLREISLARYGKGNDQAVIVTSGASMAITTALTAVCSRGDTVLLPTIGYPGTTSLVKTLGLNPGFYNFVDGKLNISTCVSKPPKVVILNSPNNPTGKLATNQDILSILEYCAATGAILISDEVYHELIYEGSFRSPASYTDDVTIFQIHSLSKSCALSGWRIGFLIVPQCWEHRMKSVHGSLSMCASTPAQLLATELLTWTGLDQWQRLLLERMRTRRDHFAPMLRQSQMKLEDPQSGPFFWIDVEALNVDGNTFSQALLRCAGIVASPGNIFTPKSSTHIRLCFGSCTEQELGEAVTKILSVEQIIVRVKSPEGLRKQ